MKFTKKLKWERFRVVLMLILFFFFHESYMEVRSWSLELSGFFPCRPIIIRLGYENFQTFDQVPMAMHAFQEVFGKILCIHAL